MGKIETAWVPIKVLLLFWNFKTISCNKKYGPIFNNSASFKVYHAQLRVILCNLHITMRLGCILYNYHKKQGLQIWKYLESSCHSFVHSFNSSSLFSDSSFIIQRKKKKWNKCEMKTRGFLAILLTWANQLVAPITFILLYNYV